MKETEQRCQQLQQETEKLRADVADRDAQISQWEVDMQRVIQQGQQTAANPQLQEQLQDAQDMLASKVQALEILQNELKIKEEDLMSKDKRLQELESKEEADEGAAKGKDAKEAAKLIKYKAMATVKIKSLQKQVQDLQKVSACAS